MTPTLKHRPPNSTFATLAQSTPKSRVRNKRRALIVRAHRRWLEREPAKLEQTP